MSYPTDKDSFQQYWDDRYYRMRTHEIIEAAELYFSDKIFPLQCHRPNIYKYFSQADFDLYNELFPRYYCGLKFQGIETAWAKFDEHRKTARPGYSYFVYDQENDTVEWHLPPKNRPYTGWQTRKYGRNGKWIIAMTGAPSIHNHRELADYFIDEICAALVTYGKMDVVNFNKCVREISKAHPASPVELFGVQGPAGVRVYVDYLLMHLQNRGIKSLAVYTHAATPFQIYDDIMAQSKHFKNTTPYIAKNWRKFTKENVEIRERLKSSPAAEICNIEYTPEQKIALRFGYSIDEMENKIQRMHSDNGELSVWWNDEEKRIDWILLDDGVLRGGDFKAFIRARKEGLAPIYTEAGALDATMTTAAVVNAVMSAGYTQLPDFGEAKRRIEKMRAEIAEQQRQEMIRRTFTYNPPVYVQKYTV